MTAVEQRGSFRRVPRCFSRPRDGPLRAGRPDGPPDRRECDGAQERGHDGASAPPPDQPRASAPRDPNRQYLEQRKHEMATVIDMMLAELTKDTDHGSEPERQDDRPAEAG